MKSFVLLFGYILDSIRFTPGWEKGIKMSLIVGSVDYIPTCILHTNMYLIRRIHVGMWTTYQHVSYIPTCILHTKSSASLKSSRFLFTLEKIGVIAFRCHRLDDLSFALKSSRFLFTLEKIVVITSFLFVYNKCPHTRGSPDLPGACW